MIIFPLRIFAVLALCALIASCASLSPDSDLTTARESWNGARYDAMVAQWGPPQRQALTPDGSTAYSWSSQSTGARSGVSPSFSVFGSSGLGVGAGVGVGTGGGDSLRCDRTVFVRDSVVVDQKWHGNPRYCRTFARY